MDLEVLGLIPARGGSKGVPRKNARLLAGQPLIAWSIKAALGSHHLSRTIVSTDDGEIAEIAASAGAEVPFIRPPELAADDTPMIDVILHALDWAEENARQVDALCLLQPTNPFRTAADIDSAIEEFDRSGADTLFTVLPLPTDHHPLWAYVDDGNSGLKLVDGSTEPVSRRQDLPASYHREGSIYLARVDSIRRNRSLYGSKVVGFPVDPDRSVNIDTKEDWQRAEALLANQ